MTKEEIQKSSQKKVQVVNTLCKQLQLIPTAEQMVTTEGFIKVVVFFRDMENYPVDKEEEIEYDNIAEQTPKDVEPTPDNKTKQNYDKKTNKKSDNKA
jgi:hypothetical protein